MGNHSFRGQARFFFGVYRNPKTLRKLPSFRGQARFFSFFLWEKKGDGSRVVKAKALLRERLFDLSEFCKTLKQHYSMSYNLRHGYSGSIWGARFKSMILSADYETLIKIRGQAPKR